MPGAQGGYRISMINFQSNQSVLIFGGPYSNLAATLAMRGEAERLGIRSDRVICTGDVVAYCAHPEETIRSIRDWNIRVVAGNCEEQLAAGGADCGCGFEEGSACDLLSKGWYPFANARVSAESRTWMTSLPTSIDFSYGNRTFRVIHGGGERINRFIFASQADVLAEERRHAGVDVVVAGHSGIPFIERVGRGVWFNPGVIGMPANDGTTDVWYGLITADALGGITFSTHRLAYNHHSTAAVLRRSGHANGYARTIVTGFWPSLDVLPPEERAATGMRLRPCKVRLPKQSGAVAAYQAVALSD